MMASYCSFVHGSGKTDRFDRQTDCLSLTLKHLQPGGVHRHTTVFLVHCGKQAEKLNLRGLAGAGEAPMRCPCRYSN